MTDKQNRDLARPRQRRMDEEPPALLFALNLRADHSQLPHLRAPHPRKDPDRLLVHTSSGFTVLALDEVLRIESEGSYCQIFTKKEGKLLIARPMSEVVGPLAGERFMRVHQSHLLNLDEVVGYAGLEQSAALLSDGSQVPVSRRLRRTFIDAVSARCIGF